MYLIVSDCKELDAVPNLIYLIVSDCKELDAVPHLLFYNNVLTCLVCHDYKKHSELLYRFILFLPYLYTL